GAPRRLARGGLDLRGAAPDRPGRREARRRGGGGTRPAAGAARGRSDPGRQTPLRDLDRGLIGAILPGPSKRAALKSPANSTTGAHRPTTSYPIRWQVLSVASGASRRLFYAV